MDALIAIVDASVRDLPPAEIESMLEALWPGMARSQALFQGEGVLLAAARTANAAEVLGPPVVREEDGRRVIARFDWPSMAGPAAPDALTTFTWDPVTRTLTVTRDRMGESPVWLTRGGPRFACASHPRLLRALPWISADPDPTACAVADARIQLAFEETPWRALRRLPPGHRLTVSRDEIRKTKWWSLVASPAPVCDSWSDRIRDALDRAVRSRIPASGITGSQLSGGLDSTAVSLLASGCLAPAGRPLHTFSHVPAVRWTPPQPGDETPYLQAALECMPTAVPFFATGDSAGTEGVMHPHDAEVRDAARSAGVVTMLSGWGGDEGVSYNGDGLFAQELLRGHVLWVIDWCRRFGTGSWYGTTRVLYYKVVRQLLGQLPPTAGGVVSWADVLAKIEQAPAELRRDLRQRVRQRSALRQAPSLRENQRRLLASSHLANRIDLDSEWSVPAGFCFRYPLLDPELLGLVLAAPPRLFVQEGRTRTLLREAMRGIYPALIQQRHGKFTSHPRRPVFGRVDGDGGAANAARPGPETESAPTAR
jgi:asparagine synthase (glutamine-hydrolysing)